MYPKLGERLHYIVRLLHVVILYQSETSMRMYTEGINVYSLLWNGRLIVACPLLLQCIIYVIETESDIHECIEDSPGFLLYTMVFPFSLLTKVFHQLLIL